MTPAALQARPPSVEAFNVGGLVEPSPFLKIDSPRVSDWPGSAGLVLLLLATGALLIRPADLLPALSGWPVYELLVVACLIVSMPVVLQQLTLRWLCRSPISVCVLGLVPAVALSHLSRLSLYEARVGSVMMSKVCIYYLLVTALVNSVSRLRALVWALAGFIVVSTTLAVLQYYGLLNLPALASLQQADADIQNDSVKVLWRLRSIGLFNDPNDLSLILVLGIGLCGYWVEAARGMLARAAALAPVCFFVYALTLTHSRGGMLALGVGLFAFLIARLGWRNTLFLSLFLMPLFLLTFSGRQTSINFTDASDTFQTRLQRWSQTLDLFRSDPLFGIGQGNLVEVTGQVAHNSFLHAYAELGLLGGTLFLGAFYSGYRGVRRVAAGRSLEPNLSRLQPYLIGIAVAYMTGLLSLSRCYTVSTYLVLAVLAAYASLALPAEGDARKVNASLMMTKLAAAGIVFLVLTYLFVRLLVRWE